MENVVKYCKLCQQVLSSDYVAVDKNFLNKLSFILLSLKDNETSHYICSSCKENVQNALEFKSSLVNVNNKDKVSYLSNEILETESFDGVLEKQVSAFSVIENAEKAVKITECFLCKKMYDTLTVISISKILADDNMKVVFDHIPEIDLSMTKNKVVCVACQKSLTNFSHLISLWTNNNKCMKDDADDFEDHVINEETKDCVLALNPYAISKKSDTHTNIDHESDETDLDTKEPLNNAENEEIKDNFECDPDSTSGFHLHYSDTEINEGEEDKVKLRNSYARESLKDAENEESETNKRKHKRIKTDFEDIEITTEDFEIEKCELESDLDLKIENETKFLNQIDEEEEEVVEITYDDINIESTSDHELDAKIIQNDKRQTLRREEGFSNEEDEDDWLDEDDTLDEDYEPSCDDTSVGGDKNSSAKRLHLKNGEDQKPGIFILKHLRVVLTRCHVSPRNKTALKITSTNGVRQNKPSKNDKVWYRCPHCSFKSKMELSFNFHIENHKTSLIPIGASSQQLLKCKECSYKTCVRNHFERHSMRHKTLDEIFTYDCDQCPFRSKLKNGLEKHRAAIHGKNMFFCHNCSYRAKTKDFLKQHMAIHLANYTGSEDFFECPHCPFSTILKHRFQRHLNVVHENSRNFKCDKCNYRAKVKLELIRHKELHKISEEAFKCQFCSFETSDEYNFRKHKSTHNPTLYCEYCDYQTNVRQCLIGHIKHNHRTEALYCYHCSFNTKIKHRLVQHIVVNHKRPQKPSSTCKYCGYQTKDAKFFLKHVASHKNSDEFGKHTCARCGFKTNYKKIMDRHMRAHARKDSQPFKCSLCSHVARSQGKLDHHMLTHKSRDEVVMYKCKYCKHETKYVNNLKGHVRNKHKSRVWEMDSE